MPDLTYEKQHGLDAGKMICGVDEVGRGPLAGPVVAAAVILPATLPDILIHGIQDSKKLSTAQREALFDPILQHCRTSIAEASPAEIDELNILWASMLAMRRAVQGLGVKPDHALIDGNRCPKELPCPATPVVKGDAKSLSIAAASIIAKVHRDRLMTALAERHPGYGWERNAGYPTPEHLTALGKLGVTEWHRGSFAPVAQLLAPID
ncbi:MAG: ribonuclease HII [Alphaproteobacteria bacterium]|nr:ribonuclease HII [Alphaproteobacteria bacterium]MBV8549582.1 ribonuclease HII [Alphaproteobacteria bacterium]